MAHADQGVVQVDVLATQLAQLAVAQVSAPAPFDPIRAGYPLWSGSRLFVVDSQGSGASGWLYDPLTDRGSSVSAPQPTQTRDQNGLGPGRTAQAGDSFVRRL